MEPFAKRRRFPRRVAVVLAAVVAASGLVAQPQATAVKPGTPAPDTPQARATVFQRSVNEVKTTTCTGTLVTPEIVATAGHCVVNKPAPDPPPHPPYNESHPEWGNWEMPGRWYPLYEYEEDWEYIEIRIGVDKTDPRLTLKVEAYTNLGNCDCMLLRLESSVPAEDARPVPVLTRTPSLDPSDFWAEQTFTVAGFGRGTKILRTGRAADAVFPCVGDEWAHGKANKICVTTTDGSRVGSGDSGGPLYWNDPRTGTRHLVGIYQGIEGEFSGRYIATFYTGGTWNGKPLPDIRRFFERMIGPADLAFATVRDGGTVSRSHAPAGQEVSAARTGVGRYTVTMPRPTFAGNVQVTAIGNRTPGGDHPPIGPGTELPTCDSDSAGPVSPPPFCPRDNVDRLLDAADPGCDEEGREDPTSGAFCAPHDAIDGAQRAWGDLSWLMANAPEATRDYCNVERWSGNHVDVRCYSVTGVPKDTAFSVLASHRWKDAYVWGAPGHVPSASYAHSPGSSWQIERLSEGRYQVRQASFPWLAVVRNVQVTAYGTGNERCKVADWSSTGAEVWCQDPRGGFADSRFTLLAATLWDQADDDLFACLRRPTASRYAADEGCSSQSGSGTPEIRRHGPGLYRVTFEGTSPASTGGSLLVTAVGEPASAHCNIVDWGWKHADVSCFDRFGTPTDSKLMIRRLTPKG